VFRDRGPNDGQGRSLRDFDLSERLFRYPVSYLIYSRAFDGLVEPVRERVEQRLREVLTGADTSPEFAHLSDDLRQSILEILGDTKPELLVE
jgi:hypothetical protein